MKLLLVLVPLVALDACAGPIAKPTPPSSERIAVQPKRAHEGDLVTYKNGAAIGGERWVDDGDRLTSTLELAGTKTTVTIARRERRVRVEANGKVVERELPEGVIALENGSWQAYALVADAYANASEPTQVRIMVPGSGAMRDGRVRVRASDGGGGARVVDVSVGALEVSVEIDAEGRAVHARVAAQELEARRAGEAAPARKVYARPPPDEVAQEEAIEVKQANVAIRGSLWTPRKVQGPVPVALFIAGSGPTDRDGNSGLGLRTDAYRQIAESLARRGIASLRYDKRGVGESSAAFDVAKLTIDDFAADAAMMLERLRDPARFSKVSVIGHSEGGLVALLLARRTAVNALVLVATAGRPLRVVLREQLASKVDASTLGEVDRLLADITGGRPLERVPAGLTSLFNPTLAPYLRSELEIDPTALLRQTEVTTTVVQGETDAQVTIEDAKLLGQARTGVKVRLLPGLNHLLKTEASRALPQGSYTDPSRPIGPAAIDAIADAIAR